ncbi:hypothetical protein DPMN_053717 [Dreissena polymorpha]|uniref:Uncharacterized protein n=1 Tax=Dreissena polymorpha TaxID=45954 RepID=A0A9D4CLW2_DREPO|nr:hypothetical protein DPMN_053717 [Dreissena polymorpha]
MQILHSMVFSVLTNPPTVHLKNQQPIRVFSCQILRLERCITCQYTPLLEGLRAANLSLLYRTQNPAEYERKV